MTLRQAAGLFSVSVIWRSAFFGCYSAVLSFEVTGELHDPLIWLCKSDGVGKRIGPGQKRNPNRSCSRKIHFTLSYCEITSRRDEGSLWNRCRRCCVAFGSCRWVSVEQRETWFWNNYAVYVTLLSWHSVSSGKGWQQTWKPAAVFSHQLFF